MASVVPIQGPGEAGAAPLRTSDGAPRGSGGKASRGPAAERRVVIKDKPEEHPAGPGERPRTPEKRVSFVGNPTSRTTLSPKESRALNVSYYDGSDNWITRWRTSRWGMQSQMIVESRVMLIIMLIITFYAIFADDLRVLLFPKEADTPMFVVTLVVLLIFAVEIVVLSINVPGYFLKFFFWLDLIATVALLPQVAELGGRTLVLGRIARSLRTIRAMRGSRASLLGARAGRKGVRGDPSVLAHRIMWHTNTKIIMGVLLLSVGIDLLSAATLRENLLMKEGLVMLDRAHSSLSTDAAGWASTWGAYCQGITEPGNSFPEVVFLRVRGDVLVNRDASDLRTSSPVELVKFSLADSPTSEVHVDEKALRQEEAGVNIGIIVFILLALMIWMWSFSRDHHFYVIIPVERIMKRLRFMAANPLAVVDTVDGDNPIRSPRARQASEMDVIENIMGRFGRLLQVGFGEAGTGIISKSLHEGEFDPVVAGTRMYGAFGFCDIRNFTDCCEVLEEDTMIFTNLIADTVHGYVSAVGGDVNKNIGDAFFAVWKPDKSGGAILDKAIKYVEDHPVVPDVLLLDDAPAAFKARRVSAFGGPPVLEGARVVGVEEADGDSDEPEAKADGPAVRDRRDSEYSDAEPVARRVSTTAATRTTDTLRRLLGHAANFLDRALVSFLYVEHALQFNKKVQHAGQHPTILERLPGFTVRMGYGLHYGWGIEGAIGTSHKIDASYLSPHVNLSSRLESATKQFGVSVLMSDAFSDRLSGEFARYLMPIDRVTVKGSKRPLKLSTFHLAAAEGTVPDAYLDRWNAGFKAYLDGEWPTARAAANDALADEPAHAGALNVLKVMGAMAERGGVAPDSWPGYRSLDSK